MLLLQSAIVRSIWEIYQPNQLVWQGKIRQ